jgi:hypothetical protein
VSSFVVDRAPAEPPAFRVAPRAAADPAAGFDVLDLHAESIGFFAVDGDRVVLSAPHGLDAGGSGATGALVLRQDGRPVLEVHVEGPRLRVDARDPRLDARLATAVAITWDGSRRS